MPLTIRSAIPDDYDRLLPLFLGLRRFSRERHPPQPDDFELVLAASRDYLHEILARGPESRTLLALAGDDPAGYLVAVVHEPNLLTTGGAVRTGTIDELFVSDAHRGLGAGHALLAAAESWLREQGAERVEVGAYAWNDEALAFYQREGFAVWTITLRKELLDAE